MGNSKLFQMVHFYLCFFEKESPSYGEEQGEEGVRVGRHMFSRSMWGLERQEIAWCQIQVGGKVFHIFLFFCFKQKGIWNRMKRPWEKRLYIYIRGM